MRWFPVLLAAGGCSWEAPLLDSPFGPPVLLNSIEGNVVFVDNDDQATELVQTFITVFDAQDPGPPAGTGSPVTFSVVSRADWNDDLDLPAAPFGVSQLPDGEYLVNALMDVDGDFNPLDGVLAGATCGDWVGTHVSDLETLQPQSVRFPVENTAPPNPATGDPEGPVARGVRLEDVTVLLGQELTTERPVFTIPGQPSVSLEALATSPVPPTFAIQVAEVDAIIGNRNPENEVRVNPVQLGPACAPDPATAKAPVDLLGWRSCDLAVLEPCSTALLTEIRDADLDGAADLNPNPSFAALGIPDIWPLVYVEYIYDAPPVDDEGNPTGERWVTQAFPLLLQILGAAQYELPPDTVAPVGTPLLANELSVSVLPVFLHFNPDGILETPDGRPYDLVDLRDPTAPRPPIGDYSVTVISRTGQTWTVPNALADGTREVASDDDLAHQSRSLNITN